MSEYLPTCPIATAMAIVGDKWKIQIMWQLTQDTGKLHFNDFKRLIEGISDKMLSKSLKALEADHLIERNVLDSKPPRSIYSLTEMGHKLLSVLEELNEWGKLYQKMYLQIHEEI